jgi:hypothetical protein
LPLATRYMVAMVDFIYCIPLPDGQ